MELPVLNITSQEDREKYGSQFGGIKKAKQFRTVRHVYETPFVYENVELGNFSEFDLDKGPEFYANKGYITIRETKPIIAVTVVGSGCTAGGYNIVEWWDEGESLDAMKNQLVKRQCVENLNGMHPSIWMEILRNGPIAQGNLCDGRPISQSTVSDGAYRDNTDMLRHYTDNFLRSYQASLYENTTYFRVGKANEYPRKTTLRCGARGVEDPGTEVERYPADYAIRLIEVTVADI